MGLAWDWHWHGVDMGRMPNGAEWGMGIRDKPTGPLPSLIAQLVNGHLAAAPAVQGPLRGGWFS
jgi:hypothetical protein